jgi:outer membrane lipoprotein carrier protein
MPSIHYVKIVILMLLGFWIPASSYAQELSRVVSGFQQRYASVRTLSGSFQQTYRAPGVSQVESGSFWMKKPALMRWEYHTPEEKLFVADNREAFIYKTQDRQVTIQPYSESDLNNTPFRFLLGAADINKEFTVTRETDSNPSIEGTVLIRLTPVRHGGEYLFIVLELDGITFDVRRISIREQGGIVQEFLLSALILNKKLDSKLFTFKVPKGVEVTRMDDAR